MDPLDTPHTLTIRTWYFEMKRSTDLRPSRNPRLHNACIERHPQPTPELSRSFYEYVGRDWFWVDRLSWSDIDWANWICSAGYEMWLVRVAHEPAGYLELAGNPLAEVDIAYFGLLPGYMGLGLGGSLLTAGVRRAWQRGASRLSVHTCTLDGPHARANYYARGFQLRAIEDGYLHLPPDIGALRTAVHPRQLLMDVE